MLTLSVIGVEDGAIVATSPTGERYRIPVDDALRASLRDGGTGRPERRLSPREIQAHVRAGLTAQQVSALTGAPVAYVERFVGPVLAELAYIVESALAVRLPPESDGQKPRTFGSVMGERLAQLNASDVKWTSAKEPTGWVLDVSFTADEIQHEARWLFDPKRNQLVAENTEAATLSQQGTPAALTPRLRAIEPTMPVTVIPQQGDADRAVTVPAAEQPDRSRFDSAIFAFPDLKGQREQQEAAAARRGPTTDQLASLARRRGQREPTVDTGSLPVTRSMQVMDGEEDDPFVRRSPAERETSAPITRGRFPERLPEQPATEEPPLRRPRTRSGGLPRSQDERDERDEPVTATAPIDVPPAPTRPRRGRTTMPSWDEIVFGRDDG